MIHGDGAGDMVSGTGALSDGETQLHSGKTLVRDAGVVVTAAGGALLFAGWFRPLWIDEVGQLALGVVPAESILAFIYETSGPNINRGQTGIYNFVDWILLQAFGASAVAMRFPSLVAGFVLLLLAAYFVRLRGFSRPWQILAILMLVATPAVMQWTGQARIYMPLAAATVAMAAYFQVPISKRTSLIARVIAVIAFPLGAVLHPYWIVFLVLLGAFSLWQSHYTECQPFSRALREMPWKWVSASLILYLALGALTWMRGNSGKQGLWEQHGPESVIREFVYLHLSPFVPTRELPPRILIAIMAFAIGLVTLVVLVQQLRVLLPPVILGLGAALSSALIGLSNIPGSYWIESRQWIAGAALTTVAFTWLLAEAWQLGGRRLSQGNRLTGLLLATASGVAVLVALVAAVGSALDSLEQWRVDREAWSLYRAQFTPDLPSDSRPRNQAEFNDLATINVAVGGEVWPSIGTFYAGYPGVPANP